MARTRKSGEPETDLSQPAEPAPSESVIDEVELSEPDRPATAPEPPPPPTPPRTPAAAPPRRGLSVILGGAIAAAVGAGATIYALPQLPESLRSQIIGVKGSSAADVAALKADIEALKTAQSPVTTSDVTALGDALKALTSRVTATEAGLADLDAKATTLAEQLAALAAAPAGTGDAGPAIAALRSEIDALKSSVAAGGGDTAAIAKEIQAAADAAAERIKAAEADAQRLSDEAEAAGRKAAARAAMSHVEAALQSGAPIDNALADLAAAGITVPEVLTEQAAGIPSLGMLRDSFPPAARDALVLSLKDTAGDGFWNRMGAFLRSQTGARSLTPRAGTDPDAVLSRAEAALAAGDLKAALSELQGLPESGKTRMAEWSALAERRLAAETAVADLSAVID